MSPPTADPTPRSLIERLREPTDVGAWEVFVDLYTPLILSWARRLGTPEPDRAEVAQEVFGTLVKELRAFRYDPNRRFRGYLFTVTRSKVIDHLRRLNAASAATVALPDDLAGPTDHVEALIEADYRGHLVRRAIRVMRHSFEANTWQACWATVVEGKPAAEVAADLGMSVEAVYQAKTRVLRRLRHELDGLLD